MASKKEPVEKTRSWKSGIEKKRFCDMGKTTIMRYYVQSSQAEDSRKWPVVFVARVLERILPALRPARCRFTKIVS